jgi:hypothetical protein
MAKSNEVVKTEPTVVDFITDEDLEGGGFEGADKESFAIPFIQILQKMSPMVDEDNPKHVEGAKAGMLYNTVTQKLYDGKVGVRFVPCTFKRCFICWGGREGDAGFKGEFTPEQIEEMKEKGEIVEFENRLYKPSPDGGTVNPKKNDYYADTRSHFILLIDDKGDTSNAILSLSSSQTKASRILMTALQGRRIERNGVKRMPPMYANVVKLTTIGMANEKGTWSGARFDLEEEFVKDKIIFEEAKAFKMAIDSGAAKVDYSKSEDAHAAGVADEPTEAEKF